MQPVDFFIDLVVVFRGSDMDSLKNWVSSLKFISTPYPLCDNSIFTYYEKNAVSIKDFTMHIKTSMIK